MISNIPNTVGRMVSQEQMIPIPKVPKTMAAVIKSPYKILKIPFSTVMMAMACTLPGFSH